MIANASAGEPNLLRQSNAPTIQWPSSHAVSGPLSPVACLSVLVSVLSHTFGGLLEEKQMPIVSVGIPTKGNRARYLEEAIRSVLGQSLTDIEVFVSDNGSDGTSAPLVASFDDSRLQFVKLPTPGLQANLNQCLRLGTAPYVAICQDDDVWLPANLERLMDAIPAYSNVSLAHAAFNLIDENGEVLRERVFWGPWEGDAIEEEEVFIRRSMSTGTRVNMSSALIRRETLANNSFREEEGVACDVGFWLRLATTGDVAFVPEPLSALRVHPGALSVVEGINDEHRRPVMKEVRVAQAVKKRYLAEYHHRPKERRELKEPARSWARQELFNIVVRTTLPRRAFLPTMKALAQAVRIEPSLLIVPKTYRLFGASLVGRRGRRIARRLLGRDHQPTASG